MGDVGGLGVKLLESQARVCGVLVEVSAEPDYKSAPDEWSFAEVAAHMCQVEIECIWGRMQRVLTEDEPFFGRYYLNTDWDFSDVALIDSVYDWNKWRQRVVDLAGRLSAEQLTRKATHVHFGEISVLDILQIAFDHDQEHLADLRQMVKSLNARKIGEIKHEHDAQID